MSLIDTVANDTLVSEIEDLRERVKSLESELVFLKNEMSDKIDRGIFKAIHIYRKHEEPNRHWELDQSVGIK